MTFRQRLWQIGGILLAAFFVWLAASDAAWAQAPILLAEKSWAVGYLLVGLCLFLGLLAICIPRLRRIEMVEQEPAAQQAPKGAPAARPAGPYGQYGQFGQQPAFGQQPKAAAAPRAGGGALKSRMTAGLLGIFLGAYGVHRFYLGYTGLGCAMLAVTICTCGMGGMWGFIDGIMVLTGSVDRDAEGRPLQ